MMKVNGVELKFDVTNPVDLERYQNAKSKLEKAEAKLANRAIPMPDSPNYINEYISLLNSQLRIIGNFLDDAFGDGVAENLLGKTPSLNEVSEVMNSIVTSLEELNKETAVKLAALLPNVQAGNVQ